MKPLKQWVSYSSKVYYRFAFYSSIICAAIHSTIQNLPSSISTKSQSPNHSPITSLSAIAANRIGNFRSRSSRVHSISSTSSKEQSVDKNRRKSSERDRYRSIMDFRLWGFSLISHQVSLFHNCQRRSSNQIVNRPNKTRTGIANKCQLCWTFVQQQETASTVSATWCPTKATTISTDRSKTLKIRSPHPTP